MQMIGKIMLSLVVAATLFVPPQSLVAASTMETYIVLYKAEAVPADAATTIARAGGTFVYSYSAIGVVIARSDNLSFRDNLLRDSRIEGTASTAGFGVKVRDVDSADIAGAPPGNLLNPPTAFGDPFSALQWDMTQIHVPEAHNITGGRGSPAVVVGDIDTGLDKDHPDLLPNIDFANSVSCESGAPVSDPAAWDDHNGHGTHTAGTIAAASNGIGIVGVAPNVRIAGIKASIDDGFFFPEMVVCAFMWAGGLRRDTTGNVFFVDPLDVTNNSYFADPWYFNCRNDPEQRAIWKAEQRAIRFALSRGVTVVAAEGNSADDLAHPTMDVISPDFPPGSEQEREVRNSCMVIPVEIPGVVGVTANGTLLLKSFYSNYGVGVTQVTAPGGDSILQGTTVFPRGRVLSTLPPDSLIAAALPATRKMEDCTVSPCALYGTLQGTSMASPHAAGVAALIISQFGNSGLPRGRMRPGAVQAMLRQTADPMGCPDTSIYVPFPSESNGAPQTCQGGTGYNSFNGSGQVNAQNAVSHKP